MHRALSAALAAAASTLLIVLTGCGGGTDARTVPPERTAPNGDVFNEADVAFATAMIPHHAQALSMVDLARGRELSPEVRRLTVDILEAQAPEIETMVDWLTAWGEPVPATMRDHAHAGHGDGGGTTGGEEPAEAPAMPGMMSAQDLTELQHASDAEFERLWLEMMVEHHRGAIAMAEDQRENGIFAPATDLAASVVTSQRAEITVMESLLDRA